MVTKSMKLVFFFTLLFIPNLVCAQIYGLWETTYVQVGDEPLTPIAKWTQFNEDNSYFSGNGWLQNSSGFWELSDNESELLMTVEVGFRDDFGAFTIEFVGNDEMIMTRFENGEQVQLFNKRVLEKPLHPATQAVGLWMVEEAEMNGEIKTNEFVKNEFQGVLIRWDNLYQEMTMDGRRSGIWRVNAHRPVLDVLYYGDEKPLQYWELSFDGDTMRWERDGMKITFNRLDAFPD